MDFDLLSEIVESADSAKVIVKEVQTKRKKKSDTEFTFEEDQDNPNSILNNLIRYINDKELTYQDFFDYCIEHAEDGDEEKGKRLAYNIVTSLRQHRDIGISRLELLCDFLKVDIVLEEVDK